MRQFWVQFLKDFKAYFYGFTPYAIFIAYYLLSMFSALYLGDYFLRESAIMNAYFMMQPIILILILPAITMRTWADESKSGTLELLLTQPISYLKLTLAKFSAAYCFFCILVLSSLFLFFISNKFSILDIGLALSGYVCLFLCGAFFTAVGCLVSALSRNNILSYLSTIFLLFFMTQIDFTIIHIGEYSIPLQGLDFSANFNSFLSGSLTYTPIFYFIICTILCLWLNTVIIGNKHYIQSSEKRNYRIFFLLIFGIFVLSTLTISFFATKNFDITDDKKFTLLPSTRDYLSSLDKRVNITLYEAKVKREDVNSSYATYAEFVEKTLKLLEQASGGAIHTETILVHAFSPLERKLIHDDNIWFEEDTLGQKTYIAASFSDNEGNYKIIPYLNNLRQNLLETDIVRILRSLGMQKKELAIFASNEDLEEMPSFYNMLKEFYNVTHFTSNPVIIPESFAAVIVINPKFLYSNTLLAMDQYVLNGGSLIIFHNDDTLNNSLSLFLKNFGLSPQNKADRTSNIQLDIATPDDEMANKGVRSILTQNSHHIDFSSDNNQYTVKPLLQIDKKTIAAISSGKYSSNFLDTIDLDSSLLPVSTTSGKVVFVFDTTMLQDTIYVSPESKGNDFYHSVPIADNLLFLQQLLDNATDTNLENQLVYRHYAISSTSIGSFILQNIRLGYQDITTKTEEQLADYKNKQEAFYNTVALQGYASVKSIGNINDIKRQIEKIEDELNSLRAQTAIEAKNIISILTAIIVLGIPFVLLIILFIFIYITCFLKRKKIKEFIIDAEKTY